MKYCKICKYRNEDGAEYCFACGSDLSMENFTKNANDTFITKLFDQVKSAGSSPRVVTAAILVGLLSIVYLVSAVISAVNPPVITSTGFSAFDISFWLTANAGMFIKFGSFITLGLLSSGLWVFYFTSHDRKSRNLTGLKLIKSYAIIKLCAMISIAVGGVLILVLTFVGYYLELDNQPKSEALDEMLLLLGLLMLWLVIMIFLVTYESLKIGCINRIKTAILFDRYNTKSIVPYCVISFVIAGIYYIYVAMSFVSEFWQSVIDMIIKTADAGSFIILKLQTFAEPTAFMLITALLRATALVTLGVVLLVYKNRIEETLYRQ